VALQAAAWIGAAWTADESEKTVATNGIKEEIIAFLNEAGPRLNIPKELKIETIYYQNLIARAKWRTKRRKER
jgi:hypothetical protein